MKLKLIIYTLILFLGSCKQQYSYKTSDNNPKQTMAQVVSGTLIEKENFPSKYVAARNVSIWLPKGYTNKKKYSVLYMHDGQMLFDSQLLGTNRLGMSMMFLQNFFQTPKLKNV
jgi:hypothetical protein